MNIPNRAPWINLAVGILTIISPYALAITSGAVFTSTWIVGVIMVIVAIVEMVAYAQSHAMNYWPAINLLAGIWLLISTSFGGSAGMVWSDIVLGVVAIITAAVSLSYERVHAKHGHPVAG